MTTLTEAIPHVPDKSGAQCYCREIDHRIGVRRSAYDLLELGEMEDEAWPTPSF